MAFSNAYRKRRVFVTGHTGFKGSWLTAWLLELGADVTGYALPPPTTPALFDQLGLAQRIRHVEADVRHLARLRQELEHAQPEFVFHLAAQPLVRLSYREPADTFSTNVMGTVNLLEAVRLANRPCTVIIVTTDKCYENREWHHSYSEQDRLGGHDPYSASKGAAELVVDAYRRSFFANGKVDIRVASARAGNVLGGGDWALDRILPDCIRALQRAEAIRVRNKVSTRPWQHVLEPLSGYLTLGAQLAGVSTSDLKANLASAFNFGPPITANRTVAELVQEVLQHWPGRWEDVGDATAVHEAGRLNLSTDKAFHLLKWEAAWSFEQTIAHTVRWYRETSQSPDRVVAVTADQIASYTNDARARKISWTR
jgi:CDP-glucose 4,6-dehydratase